MTKEKHKHTASNRRPKKTAKLIKQEPAPAAQVTASELSRVMAALGQKGEKIGGRKGADSLTKKRRSENALMAARSRWDTQRLG